MRKDRLSETRRQSIGMRLFVTLTMMTILLSVLFTSVILYRHQREIKESLIKEGQSLAAICSESLRTAVFAEDKEMIETIVQGVIAWEGVISVTVFNDSGKILFLRSRMGGGGEAPVQKFPPYARLIESGNSFEFIRPVSIDVPYNVETSLYVDNPPKFKKTVGYVCLVIDKAELNAAMKRAILLNTLIVAVFIISIALSIYFTVRRIAGPFEFRMAELEKMEAVGTLARGIAHDFNNILGAADGYLYVLRKKLGDNDLSEYVEYAEGSIDRAKKLVESLLSFSNADSNKFRLIDLNDVVESLRQVIEPLIAGRFVYREFLSEESLIVTGDKLQLEQVFINLISNALDAMHNQGDLTIRTAGVVIDGKAAAAFGRGAGGHYACLTVQDSGEGIDPAVKSKIFEPFFTTKEVGKGTGLGLAIVYGIIKEHNGFIDVDTAAGVGTSFKVYLPFAADKISGKRKGGQGE